MTLGKNIKYYRLQAGCTQKELGEKLGYDPNAISNWERNKCEPNFDTIKNMAKALHIHPSLFFEEVNEYPSEFFNVHPLEKLTSFTGEELADYVMATQSFETQWRIAGSMSYEAFQLITHFDRKDHVLNALEQYPMDQLRDDFLYEMSAEGKENIVPVTYVSVWDDGIEIKSSAKYNRETNTVFAVERVDVDGLDLDICEYEYILFEDESEKRVVHSQEEEEYEDELKKKEMVHFSWD